MEFYKDLYTGLAAGQEKDRIIKNIKKGNFQAGVYVISLSACKEDLLDIIPSFMLRAQRYKDLKILGIALTREEAFEVGSEIIMDVYKKTGAYDVRGYFEKENR